MRVVGCLSGPAVNQCLQFAGDGRVLHHAREVFRSRSVSEYGDEGGRMTVGREDVFGGRCAGLFPVGRYQRETSGFVVAGHEDKCPRMSVGEIERGADGPVEIAEFAQHPFRIVFVRSTVYQRALHHEEEAVVPCSGQQFDGFLRRPDEVIAPYARRVSGCAGQCVAGK